ncbi:MAG: hypothetical protein ACRDRH_01370 [Pseudonocardia sp.]
MVTPTVEQLVTGWAQVVATLFLGLVGFFVANSYRRQVKVKLSEKLTESYMELWRLTEVSFINREGSSFMTRDEMAELASQMKKWYFDRGNGLLISNAYRVIFFVVYDNLRVDRSLVQPLRLKAWLVQLPIDAAERMQSCACSRQLSRLRAQMKFDLGAYQDLGHLRDNRRDERDLFAMAGVRVGPPKWSHKGEESCFCGMCEARFTFSNIIHRRIGRSFP